MTIFADTSVGSNESISKSARWTGRALSGVVILFLQLDGGMKLLPLPIVTETMDKMGYGASDGLARSLGLITIVCTLLYAVPDLDPRCDTAHRLSRWRDRIACADR
jgi:hypothetical protein